MRENNQCYRERLLTMVKVNKNTQSNQVSQTELSPMKLSEKLKRERDSVSFNTNVKMESYMIQQPDGSLNKNVET